MFRNLMIKELKLALHPASIMFMFFGAMLLIPSYPYPVAFFYVCLGIFFVCLSGRENSDIFYTMLLPVRKRDFVKARMTTVALLQVLQLAIAIPFAILRSFFGVPNSAGMDANTALFGFALMDFTAFNILFFTSYFRSPQKVGKAFLLGSIGLFVMVLVEEATTFFVPFMMALDTPDPVNLRAKLTVLAIGLLAYAASMPLIYLSSASRFEALDL